MKKYPISKVHQLLEPGPIVLVTTQHRGRPNVMTMGFHMMIQHEPPLVGAVIGPWDYSYKALRATKECVIAIPKIELINTVVDIGNCSGEEIDKFKKFGLTPTKASKVKAPLIEECVANIECKVVDTRLVNSYNLFILKAVDAWHDGAKKRHPLIHHQGNGTFTIDGKTIDLRKRMTKWKSIAV